MRGGLFSLLRGLVRWPCARGSGKRTAKHKQGTESLVRQEKSPSVAAPSPIVPTVALVGSGPNPVQFLGDRSNLRSRPQRVFKVTNGFRSISLRDERLRNPNIRACMSGLNL